jgi:hypothetical protein
MSGCACGENVLETLEGRVLLSVNTAPLEARAGKPAGPAIRLDVVVLHELGHALGLGHIDDQPSIMNSYYNAGYDLGSFMSDPAVAALQALYAQYPGDAPSPYWTDYDERPADADATIDVTYSFMRDGTRLESGRSDIFKVFDAKFGRQTWQDVFRQQLQRWSDASGGVLTFSEMADGGQAWGTSGREQGDSRFGDIRIGSHRMDGAASVLAHAWLPSTGTTVSGDLHLDSAENWVLSAAASTTTATRVKLLPGGERLFSGRTIAGVLELDRGEDLLRLGETALLG